MFHFIYDQHIRSIIAFCLFSEDAALLWEEKLQAGSSAGECQAAPARTVRGRSRRPWWRYNYGELFSLQFCSPGEKQTPKVIGIISGRGTWYNIKHTQQAEYERAKKGVGMLGPMDSQGEEDPCLTALPGSLSMLTQVAEGRSICLAGQY